MALVLNEDEKLLQESAQGFFTDKAPVKALRRLRDERDETGFDRPLWREMADMGFNGVLIDEAYGGVNMGYMAAGLIAEQMGTQLTASPFLSTGVLAATALQTSGLQSQMQQYLPKITSGETVMALAIDETGKHGPKKTALTAQRSGNGFRLNGDKTMVLDGHVADQLIVVARSGEDKLTLFLVDPNTPGITRSRTIMLNSHNSARINFDNVEVTADTVIGEVDAGMAVLKPVLNAGRAIVSAQMLGASTQAYHMTVAYIRERKQFGVPVGSFQALQHRAAHLYAELELARSAVLATLRALDMGDVQVELYVAMTKAKLGQVAKLAALEGIQMHGGVGMTDEYDIGLYLKHIRVLQELLGDGYYHMDTVARMKGY